MLVVYEDNLGFGYLVGWIEYVFYMGVMLMDFILIKVGVLYCVNGGYFVMDVE